MFKLFDYEKNNQVFTTKDKIDLAIEVFLGELSSKTKY